MLRKYLFEKVVIIIFLLFCLSIYIWPEPKHRDIITEPPPMTNLEKAERACVNSFDIESCVSQVLKRMEDSNNNTVLPTTE